jgi:hypothetical protein
VLAAQRRECPRQPALARLVPARGLQAEEHAVALRGAESAFAASTCASPLGRIRPSAVSRSTFATLRADQTLRGRRGV